MTHPQPTRVLVVDDNEVGRYALSRLLRREGFDVIEAATGREALRLAAAAPQPDLMILDVNLPDMDGFAVCQALKQQPATTHLPVVHLSAVYVQDSDKVYGLESGADAYLTGPVEPPVLLATVQALLRIRRAEAARFESEERLRLALEAAMAGSFDWDMVTGAVVGSPEYCTLLGLEPGSHTPTYTLWRDRVHPEDIGQVEAVLHPSLAEQRDVDVEYRVIRPDGTLRWVSTRGHTFYNAAGEPVRMVGLMLDITGRKQTEAALRELNATLEQRIAERTSALQREVAERQQMQAAMLQREKLAAMGSLLASVAHELNNPLSIILLHTDLLQAEAGPGLLAEYAAEITQASLRCERLVRQFLTLARQQAPERGVVDLNALITDTLELLAPSLRVDTIAVELHLAEALPLLWADAHQLQQVVINLLTNAQQALRDVAGPRQLTLTTEVNAAQTRVTLEVADTGLGMSPEVQARIFEPFFTTKPPGIGTGLGLPLCRSILEDHGGTLQCTSQVGQGTTFRVELQVGSIPETPPASADEGTALPPVSRSTILIVDDEPGIARALTRLLRRDGHTVDTAANGRLALMKLQERQYDVILSDLRMPELDGPGLYRALATLYPQLCRRFILLTGDTLNPETQAFSVRHSVPQLFKPYTAAEIRRVLQQVLQARRDAPGSNTARVVI